MRRRNAFTIIELLVAMALVMFIMAILSTAFATATQTFRNLKAVGDMTNKLRAVTTLLQRDLAADHFEGKKRLSNPNFWLNGPPAQGFFRVWQGSPPSAAVGLYVIEGADLDAIPSYRSVNHMLAFTVKLRGDQMGDFMTAGSLGGGTVLGALPAFGPQEARYQTPGTYNYQWAEVTWFLQPQYQIDPTTGLATVQDTTAGGVPLWTLYRNQRLAVPDNFSVTPPPTPPISAAQLSSFLEVSCWANLANLYFNNPIDLTVPGRRFGMNAFGIPITIGTNGLTYPTLAQQGGGLNPSSPLYNADAQATDVVSFDISLLFALSINPLTGMPVPATLGQVDPFVSLYHPLLSNTPAQGLLLPTPIVSYNNGNTALYNSATNPTGPMFFDTWSSVNDGLSNYSQWLTANAVTSIPLWNAAVSSPALPAPIIMAIQVTIRVWDFKTQQTREVTIVQAM